MINVYVLLSEKFNRTYTGTTKDVEKKLKQHNSKYNKSTKPYVPWVLIYSEPFNTGVEARTREKYLKSGIGREFIKSIINNWPRSSTE
ncbi:GIY-YIG nuclease family protein [Aureibaculum sp. 2210JD6-5]|uniref:GIY-YIG nuclease family protein n=1 Tax=Aureibaculum sp. 2210JD6-5 TaxID=3103957 RepID=UPI002AAE78CF|nr:GIY-YIG nuclease family protein [Aureibaculum sp. 2210JD6-5]MDY7394518.1 GIY-YIG nuclease family protein [Aureibaculum sp. 2210JD6-5]